MTRSTRTKGRKGFRLARRLLSPVEHLLGLAENIGKSGLRRTRNVFKSAVGFAKNTVGATGKHVNGAFSGLVRGKKARNTRRNRSRSRSQRR